jgi:hypothetical protein
MATEQDKVNVGALSTIVVVGALAMVGIAAAVTALVRTETDDLGAQVGANVNVTGIREAKAEQLAKMDGTTSWVDRANGKLHIPVARAMDIVVANLERNPESATPPPPPSASAAPPDAGAPDAGPEKRVTEGAGSPAAPEGAPRPEPKKTNSPTPDKMPVPDSPAPTGELPKVPTPTGPAPAAPPTHAP